MISETLNTRGFNVIASSGDAKDSVPLCEKFKPDLILMDICTENNSSGLAYNKRELSKCENYSYDRCTRFNIYRQGKS